MFGNRFALLVKSAACRPVRNELISLVLLLLKGSSLSAQPHDFRFPISASNTDAPLVVVATLAFPSDWIKKARSNDDVTWSKNLAHINVKMVDPDDEILEEMTPRPEDNAEGGSEPLYGAAGKPVGNFRWLYKKLFMQYEVRTAISLDGGSKVMFTYAYWYQDNKNLGYYAMLKEAFLGIRVREERTAGETPKVSVSKVPKSFEELLIYATTVNGVNLYGYKDLAGNVVVPPRYHKASSFSEGYGRVGLENEGLFGKRILYGYIDHKGREITPLKYELVENFQEGLAAVKLEGKWGFIKTSGETLVLPAYGSVYSFSEGMAMVSKEVSTSLFSRSGYIDKTGKLVIPLIYRKASSFKNGRAEVVDESNRKFFIDKSGKEIK